jgi:hypothetical protein
VNSAIVRQVTDLLLAPPYGDEKGSISDTQVLYAGSVELFQELTGSPVPEPKFDEDPVLACVYRGALDQALAEISRNPEAVLDFDVPRRITSTSNRQSQSATSPMILTDWATDDAAQWIGERLRSAFRRDAGIKSGIEFIQPTDSLAEQINESVDLLRTLLPSIAASATAHVGAIAVLRAPFESAHLFETPHVIYIHQRMFRHPLVGADSILHESLHQKLVDLRVARFYTKLAFNTAGPGDVVIPWGQVPGTTRTWPVGRVVSACHVYVHLTLLFLAASLPEHASFGLDPNVVADRLVTRFARASYLAAQLGVATYRDQLGTDGVGLADDFASALQVLASATVGDRPLCEYSTCYDGLGKS